MVTQRKPGLLVCQNERQRREQSVSRSGFMIRSFEQPEDKTMNMHAMRLHGFGGPDALKDDVLPLPQPRDDEVLVRVEAASVNPVDAKMREGKVSSIQAKDLPLTLGRDLSGVIESCGTAVQGLRKGDEVFAFVGYDRGAYAQYVMVKSGEFAPKPENLSHVEAAAVPLAGLTAWQGLLDHGNLSSGQRVLIHGGAGGVGHFAVQIAKTRGAWVAATCSGRDMDFVKQLGADQVIDYQKQKFEEEIGDIDLVFDLVDGETQNRSFAVLKQGGTLVSTVQEPDKTEAKAKNVRVALYMATPNAAQLAEIGRLLLAGKIRPYVFRTFELEEAGKAEQALAEQHVQGKIVLTVNL
jgi:NADPH:quinone reductase-like Zn-dependent oxidoreductase